MNGPRQRIAVLPLGATEQHGPHLPADTDWMIAEEVARRLAAAVGERLPAVDLQILPVEKIGYSPEHLDFAATRSLGFAQAAERWIAVGEGLARGGVRKLILLNAHGGNSPLMTVVATELRVRHSMLCVATSWTRHLRSGAVGDKEREIGIHGGTVETSVMLAIAPERVDRTKAGDFPSFQEALARRHRNLRAYGPHAFGWKIADLNAQGAVGNAAGASARKGEALLAMAVEGLASLVGDVAAFDLAHFDAADQAGDRQRGR
jgi:creatinine amidohydrolase